MKNNKKGMTLVEVIIAMGVFAVATTGFIMTATACYKAQAKTKKRMETSNTQTTNLEHFSNYNQVIDPEDLNVEPMNGGSNRWVMTFPFPETAGGPTTNTKVYGYYSVADPDDPTYDLSFFSPIEQVPLEDGEYWINLYNENPTPCWYKVEIVEGGQFEFFNNEKVTKGTELPERMWGANGGCRRFGVRSLGGDITEGTIKVTNIETGDSNTFDLASYVESEDGDISKGYVFMHLVGMDAYNDEQFNALRGGGE